MNEDQLRLERSRCITRINELTVVLDEVRAALIPALGYDRTQRLFEMASREGMAFVADQRRFIEKRERELYGPDSEQITNELARKDRMIEMLRGIGQEHARDRDAYWQSVERADRGVRDSACDAWIGGRLCLT